MCGVCDRVWVGWWCAYGRERGAVVGTAQFGDAVKEDGGHLLVAMLDEAEHLKREPAHLALPVLQHRRLRVLMAPGPSGNSTYHERISEHNTSSQQNPPLALLH